MNNEYRTIFDDFPVVECNECEHFWNNSCDGVRIDQKRPCKSFLATRKVNLPREVESLKKTLFWLKIGYAAITGVVVAVVMSLVVK